MSHQAGIQASDSLKEFLATAKTGHIRLIKIDIDVEKEELVLSNSEDTGGKWQDDYVQYVVRLLEDKKPTFIFFRFDEQKGQGYEWLFIHYVPDFAPIKLKMLYSSTKATIKREFGGGLIKDELFGTVIDDISLKGYEAHIKSCEAPAPLTAREEELEEIKKNELKVDIGTDSKHQTMPGISFPTSNEVLQRLNDFRDKKCNYVQVQLDIANELLTLADDRDTTISDLPSRVPKDTGRFHLFWFPHTYEGDYLESIVFIYSMPGYKAPVKERMLYSSSKGPFTDYLESGLGMEIAKKIEIDDGAELTEEFVYDEVHPKKTIVKKQFDRPKGPAGRGPRRVTKDK